MEVNPPTLSLEALLDLAASIGIRLLLALAFVVIGRVVARVLQRAAIRAMKKAELDETLVRFSGNLLNYLMLLAVLVGALMIMGVQTASIAAAIASLGLAIGLALQGGLANFPAGMLILLLRPYSVDDTVKVNDVFGRVDSLQILNTKVITPKNEVVVVPNGQILANNITNYTERGYVRLDMTAGIGYSDDLLAAKELLEELLHEHPAIMQDPAPQVGVSELADSSVNFALRAFVKIEDYWRVHFDLTEQIKLSLDAAGISIPFPQRDVHLIPVA